MYLTWVDCREPEYLFHENRRQADAVLRKRVSSVGTYTASMDILEVASDGSTTLLRRVFHGDVEEYS